MREITCICAANAVYSIISGQVRRRRGRVMLLRHTAAAWLYEKNKTYPHADTVRIGFLQFALEEAQ